MPKPKDSHQRMIETARKLLQPSPVICTGDGPPWLDRLLREALRTGRFLYRGVCEHHLYDPKYVNTFMLLQSLAAEMKRREFGSPGWFDHTGMTQWEGRECFVSEPYGLDVERLENFVAVSRFLKVGYLVLPNSWHFPGRTIRLLLLPPTTSPEPPK